MPKDLKELVLLRLEAMPSNIEISLGEFGVLSKQDLIEHVRKEDSLGKLMVDMQLKYLQSMKRFAYASKDSAHTAVS